MDLETLLAEREISRALTRMARAMDAKDWPAVQDGFAPDACADFGVGVLQGAAAIVDMMRTYLDACGPTQHLLGNLLVDVEGAQATSKCYVSDMHIGVGEKAALTYRTLGDYHDRWELRDGRWLIVERIKHNRAHIGSPEVLGTGPLEDLS